MDREPCVYETHWQKWGKQLHLTVNVRSNDLGLGNPYNLYQYAVGHRLIAQVTGHQAGTICFNIDNAHIYDRHMDILLEQIKAPMHDAPKIEIFTENVKDMILIKVKDHGLGMSKIAQKRVFEKFYREHTGDLHNVKGHGLGLAYVKRIVEDHNGQVYVESEKGKGSTFIIKIPLIN